MSVSCVLWDRDLWTGPLYSHSLLIEGQPGSTGGFPLKLLLSVLFLAASVASSPAIHAGGVDSLLSYVPKKVSLVVAIDHSKLKAHPHYKPLMKFLAGQDWATGLGLESGSGLEIGAAVKQSVTFRMAGNLQGSLVTGKLDPTQIEAFFKSKLGASFKTGAAGGKSWFAVSSKLVAASLDKNTILIGHTKLVTKTLEHVASKGKAVGSRSDFKKLQRDVAKGSPEMWAIAFVPKRTRDGLAKRGAGDMAAVDTVAIRLVGKGDVVINVTAFATDAAAAKAVVDGINGKIERKIIGSALMRTLGVARMMERVKITATGKTVLGTVPLTTGQVKIIAKLGGKIFSAFGK